VIDSVIIGVGLVFFSDYRFTSQCNQGGFCWTAFNELLLCKARLGAEDPKCIARHKNMLSQCPSEWVCCLFLSPLCFRPHSVATPVALDRDREI
jgi:hypothetical protein